MPTLNHLNSTKSSSDKHKQSSKDVLDALATRKALWQSLPQKKRDEWRVVCPEPILAELLKLYAALKEVFQ